VLWYKEIRTPSEFQQPLSINIVKKSTLMFISCLCGRGYVGRKL